MSDITWHTEKRKLLDLHKNPKNPQKITEENFNRLSKDLDDLGNMTDIVVDTENTIIGGNQRYEKFLKDNGEEFEIEVKVPSRKLSENEKKKAVIILNKGRGEDDIDILANEYEDVLKELAFDNLLLDCEPSDLEREKKNNDIQILITIREKCELTGFREKLDEILVDYKSIDYSLKAGEV